MTKQQFHRCQNCPNEKGLIDFVGGLNVVLCSDCSAEIFEKSLGLTDREIRNKFFH